MGKNLFLNFAEANHFPSFSFPLKFPELKKKCFWYAGHTIPILPFHSTNFVGQQNSSFQYSTLSKYDTFPESLKVISDGNPIYNVAVQYWTQNGLPFQLFQVIGLTNQDDISKEYRSQKQIIERFNRTLKYYYRPKGGFTSLDNANNYMVLFATYNNFLRPNKSLNWKTPVELPELDGISNMPNKWITLLEIAKDFANPYTI